MKKKHLLTLIIFSLLYLCLKTSFSSVHAQNLSITAFPDTQDVNVKAGEKRHLQVEFKNGSDAPVIGTVHVADYIVVDKTGTVKLIEGNEEKPKFAASTWLSLSQSSMSIPPNDFVPVDIFVNVPQNAANCGNYALVYFQPDTQAQLGQTGKSVFSATTVQTKIGALINFRITDTQCNESLSLISFIAPSFSEFGPVKANFEILNAGNIHLLPTGTVSLTNMLGKYVDSQAIKDQRIFPGTAKTYETTVGHKWMFGRYKISLAASYGDQGKKIAAETYAWVIPWRITLIIILALIIIYLLLRSTFGRFKKESIILEKEVEHEKDEIEKLKETLRKRKE